MKNKTKVLNYLKQYSVIVLGCVIFSLGTSLFLDAHDIAPGGVTGIAIIINHLIGLALGREIQITGILIIVINVPMFILGIIFLGKQFVIPSVFATVLSSLLMLLWSNTVLPYMPDMGGDTLLMSALIGGAMFGVGLGLIFRMDATTGGTDILVKILRKKFRYLRTGVISMAVDMIIVAGSAAAFQNFILACYTVLAIVVYVVLFDWLLYGGNTAKLVYVITTAEHAEVMCERILNELDAGATLIDANGAYTKLSKKALAEKDLETENAAAEKQPYDRQIIMCAIKGFLYPRLHDAVKETDPNAFMIVSSAKEIYGEGYRNHNDDEL